MRFNRICFNSVQHYGAMLQTMAWVDDVRSSWLPYAPQSLGLYCRDSDALIH